MSRWKPTVGDRVHRRWMAHLGVGVVEQTDRGGTVRVRFAKIPTGRPGWACVLFTSARFLVREGCPTSVGPGLKPDIAVAEKNGKPIEIVIMHPEWMQVSA